VAIINMSALKGAQHQRHRRVSGKHGMASISGGAWQRSSVSAQ